MAGVDRPLLRPVVVVVAASLAACSYDWTVDRAAGAGDGAADVESRPDAEAVDAGDASAHDSSTSGVDSGVGPRDTGAPPIDATSSCAQLTQTLLQARTVAISCNEMSASACMTTVKDECGCDLVVGGNSSNETAFANALAAFTKANCSTTTPVQLCPGTCPTVTHVCLAVDGGASYACYQ